MYIFQNTFDNSLKTTKCINFDYIALSIAFSFLPSHTTFSKIKESPMGLVMAITSFIHQHLKLVVHTQT